MERAHREVESERADGGADGAADILVAEPLSVGKHRWRLGRLQADVQSLELLAGEQLPSDVLLDRWIRDGPMEASPRGLCDATLIRT